MLFRSFCCKRSRLQLMLGRSDYWDSLGSPHILCHGEVTQSFSVLSLPCSLRESDQKHLFEQEPLTLTSCQDQNEKDKVQSDQQHTYWPTCSVETNMNPGILLKTSSWKLLTISVWRWILFGCCQKVFWER